MKIGIDIPTDHIPYKNRWGHYVWRAPGVVADPNWPGTKPPQPNMVATAINNEWHWVEIGRIVKMHKDEYDKLALASIREENNEI